MKTTYRNNTLEGVLAGVRGVTSIIALASFALLFGFYEPPIPERIVFGVQTAVLIVFVGISITRLFNAESRREYLYANWYDLPALLVLGMWFVLQLQEYAERSGDLGERCAPTPLLPPADTVTQETLDDLHRLLSDG